MTLRQIGKVAGGLSESFISRVANGQSNFTCEHFEEIEKNLGQPIAFLFLSATPTERIPEEKRELHKTFLRLVQKMDTSSDNPDKG